MPKSKRRKAKAKRTGRKGRRGVRKSEKRVKRKKARKSSKRSRAAKKAARTRMMKKEARRAAARKAARSRKRKGGGKRKARKSGKRKSSKRSAAARKGARTRKANKTRKSGKRRSSRRASPERIYKRALTEGNRHERAAARLRKQYESALKANKTRSAAQVEKLRKQQERLKARLQYHEGMAAESKRRKGKRRGGKRREKNPIGSGGMHEYGAVAGGVLTAIALTIIPYRMIRSHALTSGAGQGTAGMIDAPNKGDVPNLLTGQLPLWSRLKWKGAIALGVVLVGDIAVPLFVASRIKTSDGWKTFFQLWGWTSVGLASTKLVVDVLAFATKNTSLGQRLFAPENTSRDVRAMSATTQLPAIAVAPGVGMPGLTGYGSPPDDPKRHTGAAGCGCGDCEAKRKTAAGNQPGTKQPITGPTPMPPTVASTVTGLPQNSAAAPGAAGAAGAPGTVTPINKFAPRNRFDSRSRFGNQ